MENRFLIVGSQRSGTSLLTRIMDSHSQLGVTQETAIFNYFVPFKKYYGDLSSERNLRWFVKDVLASPRIRDWEQIPSVDTVIEALDENSLDGVFRALLNIYGIQSGKRLVGEKTPTHLLYWQRLTASLDYPKTVHIVRDGRDVALGLIKARFGPKTMFAAAKRWRLFVSKVIELQDSYPSDRFIEIRYEDLLLTPDDVIGQICQFLGVDFEESMLDFHRSSTSYSAYEKEHANLNKPLLTSKVGMWKKLISRREQRIFESIAEPMLKRFGYEARYPAGCLTPIERFWYGCLLNPVIRAIGLARNRPGQAEGASLLLIRIRMFTRYFLKIRWTRT